MTEGERPTVSSDESGPGLPVEQALLLEGACDAFERGWRSGGRPDIPAAAAELPAAGRPAARRALRAAAAAGAGGGLVALDVCCRRRRGEHPAADDYAGRFPGLDPLWLAGQ